MKGRGWPRPIIVPKAAVVLELIALALFVIARTTGAGWDIVLLCGIIAVVLTGSVLPAIVLATATVGASAPRDARVGRPFALDLTAQARSVRLRVTTFDSTWVRVDRRGSGPILVVPQRRGVLTHVTIELVTAAPLGLARWRRRIRVALPVPVEVAPRVEPTACPVVTGDLHTPTSLPRTALGGNELTRGVREYRDGDPIRSVHWPATARTGTVMVREHEAPRRPSVVVVVDLHSDDPELTASRAAGMIDDALRQGARVRLATAETDGPRLGSVPTSLHAGRRLARAVAGAPANGPFGPDVSVHRLGGGAA